MSTESSGRLRPRLTLLVRTGCHLCDEMREALAPLLSGRGATLEVIDVDDDGELEARWGERVPVLLAGGRELCHYRLDRAALAAWLAGASG